MNLWIFDFDGTLSDIVPDREAAALHPACRALLETIPGIPGNIVAVLSSREIDDLASRIPAPRRPSSRGQRAVLCDFPGGSASCPGTRWRSAGKAPEGPRADPEPSFRLSRGGGGGQGVVGGRPPTGGAAGHHPHAGAVVSRKLAEVPGTRTYRGTYAVEVQLFHDVSKSFGVRRLCRLLRFDPPRDKVVYAGDDENDAVAMRWVLKKGGIAFCVGGRVRVRGARPVDDPAALARAVRDLSEVP